MMMLPCVNGATEKNIVSKLKVYPPIFRSKCCLRSVHYTTDECLCCGGKNGFFAELESGHDEDDIRMFTGWTEKELDDFTNDVARDCHYHLDDDCDQILDSVIEIIMDQPEEYICDKVKQTEKGNV